MRIAKGNKKERVSITIDENILETLKKHSGPVLISGYPSAMYDSELSGWRRETTTTTDQLSRRRLETIWMNFDPERQITLFE